MDLFSDNSEELTVIVTVLTRSIPLIPDGYYLSRFLEKEGNEFGGLCV